MAVARRLDRYELLEEIGAGGMATVYRALDSELEREVAVKVLHPHLASQPDARTRFQREAKAVAKLRHNNILDIFDYSGADSDESYIVVELIHGPTLKRFVEGAPRSSREDPDTRRTPAAEGVGRMPIEVAAMVVHDICAAVSAAHAQGIIHRDIKPENVMIREDGVLKLTDFGIAQILDANSMTVTGQILGSPAHMAPEQIEAQEIDFRADIFSIGTVLYYLAAGRLPFEGKNPHHLLKKIMDGDYPDPLRVEPAMGERLAGIIRRCLARKPADRYSSADDLRADLAAFLLDLGVQEPSIELRHYFAEPASYTATHREKIVKVLLRRGQEERKSGHLPAALDYFNRVLALDENNSEVLRIVGGIERRKRVMQLAMSAGLLAVLGAGTGFGWSAMTREDPREEREPAAEVEEREDEESLLEGRARISPEVDAGAKKGRPRLQSVAKSIRPAAPTTRQVVFNPGECQNVHVFVDSVDLGEYGRIQDKVLPVGSYTVEYRPNPGVPCTGGPFQVTVAPGQGAQPIPWRTFAWQNASLRVDSNVRGASVSIPQRASGESGTLIEVRMRGEAERLQVLVEASGYVPAVKDLNFRAGRVERTTVTLQRENGTGTANP